MTPADEAYAANAASELVDLTLRKTFELPGQRERRREKAREVIRGMAAHDREWVVKTLLDELFGEKGSHEEVARDLLPRFADTQGILIRALRWLTHYKEEGTL